MDPNERFARELDRILSALESYMNSIDLLGVQGDDIDEMEDISEYTEALEAYVASGDEYTIDMAMEADISQGEINEYCELMAINDVTGKLDSTQKSRLNELKQKAAGSSIKVKSRKAYKDKKAELENAKNGGGTPQPQSGSNPTPNQPNKPQVDKTSGLYVDKKNEFEKLIKDTGIDDSGKGTLKTIANSKYAKVDWLERFSSSPNYEVIKDIVEKRKGQGTGTTTSTDNSTSNGSTSSDDKDKDKNESGESSENENKEGEESEDSKEEAEKSEKKKSGLMAAMSTIWENVKEWISKTFGKGGVPEKVELIAPASAENLQAMINEFQKDIDEIIRLNNSINYNVGTNNSSSREAKKKLQELEDRINKTKEAWDEAVETWDKNTSSGSQKKMSLDLRGFFAKAEKGMTNKMEATPEAMEIVRLYSGVIKDIQALYKSHRDNVGDDESKNSDLDTSSEISSKAADTHSKARELAKAGNGTATALHNARKENEGQSGDTK